ncbi:MAG: hypothetical protein AAGA68_25075 [Pseudomonadota bacterium]
MSRTTYIPLAQFGDHHPWPSPKAWRHIVHEAERHGRRKKLYEAVVTIDGRRLIDEARFMAIMAEMRETA